MDRRSFLKSAPLAAVAISAPAMAVAVSETPEQKVRRLSGELSRALTDYDGGRWYAMIYPPESHPLPMSFGLVDLHESQEQKVKRMLKNVQFEMSKLPSTRLDGVRKIRFNPEGSSYAHYHPRNDSGDDAELLLAVMAPLDT